MTDIDDYVEWVMSAQDSTRGRSHVNGLRPHLSAVIDGQAITVEIVDISPDVAKEMLERNVRNRSLKLSQIGVMAKDMRPGGDWVFNGATIVFDWEGVLCDGQNRLHAIVRSGQTIPMIVVSGVRSSAQQTQDIGNKRRLSDQLKINGEKNYSHLASALGILNRVLATGEVFDGGQPDFTIAKGMRLLDEHPTLRDSDRALKAANGPLRYSAGVAMCLHYLFTMVNAEDADYFFDRLHDGVGLTDTSPIRHLRNKIERRNQDIESKGGNKSARQLAAWTIIAWNAYRRGEEMHMLRWVPGGKKPQAFPRWDATMDIG